MNFLKFPLVLQSDLHYFPCPFGKGSVVVTAHPSGSVDKINRSSLDRKNEGFGYLGGTKKIVVLIV